MTAIKILELGTYTPLTALQVARNWLGVYVKVVDCKITDCHVTGAPNAMFMQHGDYLIATIKPPLTPEKLTTTNLINLIDQGYLKLKEQGIVK